MQKSAPSIGRILIAVGFTLSCFGLLLFLWVAFGGPVPLKPESYRHHRLLPGGRPSSRSSPTCGSAASPSARSSRSSWRRSTSRSTARTPPRPRSRSSPSSRRSPATPGRSCARRRCSARRTSSSPPAPSPAQGGAPVSLGAAANNSTPRRPPSSRSPRAATLGLGQAQDQTQIDEIFNALDDETRDRLPATGSRTPRSRSRVAASTSTTRSATSAPFLGDASDVLAVLRRQRDQLQGLVRDTGTVFDALSERDDQLADAITGSNDDLRGARLRGAGATRLLPDPRRPSRTRPALTFERLDAFQENTRPLVRRTCCRSPTTSARPCAASASSPRTCESLFFDLDDLNRASRDRLPGAGQRP